MATYSKPASVPRWADTSGNITEPPEGKKDAGWLFEEIPPSSFENWKENLNGNWWQWVNERFFDGTTNDELVINDTATSTGAMKVSAAGIRSTGGLKLNDTSALTGTVNDGDVMADGINCGGGINPAPGDGIFTGGAVVGVDAAAIADRIIIGDTNSYVGLVGGGANWNALMDSGDAIQFVRATDTWDLLIASTSKVRVTASAITLFENVTVSADLTADGLTAATGDIVATAGNISATAGDLLAPAGGCVVGGVVTAGTNMVAAGNIESTGGFVKTTEADIRHQSQTRILPLPYLDDSDATTIWRANAPYLYAPNAGGIDLRQHIPLQIGERLTEVAIYAYNTSGSNTPNLDIRKVTYTDNVAPPFGASVGSVIINSGAAVIQREVVSLTETVSADDTFLVEISAGSAAGSADFRVYLVTYTVDRL